jgi:hypothetical protein
VLHIDGDAAAARVLAAENQVHQVLQRNERVAAAADEQAEVLALDIDDGEDGTAPVSSRNRLPNRNFSIDIENPKQVINELGRVIDFDRVDIGIDRRLVLTGGAVAGRPRGPLRTSAILVVAATGWATAASAAATIAGFARGTFSGRGTTAGAAGAREIGVGELRLRLFEPGTAAAIAATATVVSAARTILSAAAASTRLASSATAVTALAATFALAGYARIGRAGWGRSSASTGEASDADYRVLCAAAKEAAAFSFIEHDELDLFEASSKFGERLVTGVFDGFAVCFGLIHSLSSIHERVLGIRDHLWR